MRNTVDQDSLQADSTATQNPRWNRETSGEWSSLPAASDGGQCRVPAVHAKGVWVRAMPIAVADAAS